MAERKTTRVGELLPILAAAATLALMLLWLVLVAWSLERGGRRRPV